MVVTKSRKYTINMGDYNSFSFESTVTVDSERDLGFTVLEDNTVIEVLDFTDQVLVESLREEVNQSRFAPNQKSAILTLLANNRK